MEFEIISEFIPTGDQPEAIRQLAEGVTRGDAHQVLLGVTGSGKTFTIANVIEKVQRPTLVLSHNKTLAAQLYGEFRQFFPNNRVEYFVSYYDYYQPEAYIPVTDTYIEKDLSINKEIEKLRLSATSALLSGRRDVIVVSSVSCLYGIGNPEDFHSNTLQIRVGQKVSRNRFLAMLVDALYSRTEADFNRGNFRVRGDSVDVFVAYDDFAYRILFWGDEIESIQSFDPVENMILGGHDEISIFPATIFVTTRERINEALNHIQDDLASHVRFFREQGRNLEARRIEDRVIYDLEMIKELGYCSGIENYSRYFDARRPGERPFCLIDYFPKDFLMVVDESHVTIPQIRAMYGGDHSRKINLVEYGFRLPAAIDNRPLKFEEFENLVQQTIYVSATPADYELSQAGGVVVEQIIRPTGILDPPVEVRPSLNQVDDLIARIRECQAKKQRVLVTTLTKRMAEELSKYLDKMAIPCRYIHSDVDTLERIEIMDALRKGAFDVLVGINLLREGLDLPEVSLVAILDADKEGFLRSARSLTQTAGRAARNLDGRVIMYAEKITPSMQQTIDQTAYRREKQMAYNLANHITPTAITKQSDTTLGGLPSPIAKSAYVEPEKVDVAADPIMAYMSSDDLRKSIDRTRQAMKQAARDLDFIEAARLRDELASLEKLLESKL